MKNPILSSFDNCYKWDNLLLGVTAAGDLSVLVALIGYHEETDSVLIMDVARFKYPPHWVPLMHLADAMLKDGLD